MDYKLYLTTENKNIIKHTIHELTVEQYPDCNIDILKSYSFFKDYLLQYTNISVDMIDIICKYTEDIIDISICCDTSDIVCYDDEEKYLIINCCIRIQNMCNVDIKYIYDEKDDSYYDIYLDNDVPINILQCEYYSDERDLYMDMDEHVTNYDNIFRIQYFFNEYMKQRYNYDNYISTHNDEHNNCKYAINNRYIHTKSQDIYTDEDDSAYYMLQVNNDIFVTDMIIITNLILNELRTILNHSYINESIKKMNDVFIN